MTTKPLCNHPVSDRYGNVLRWCNRYGTKPDEDGNPKGFCWQHHKLVFGAA